MHYIISLIVLTLCSLTANAAVIELVEPGRIVIHGVILEDDPEHLNAALQAWLAQDDVPAQLIIDIDSNGGCALAGITMHERIKKLSSMSAQWGGKVTCVVQEDCAAASAAAIIWNAGNEQVLLKGARVVYHLPYRPASPGPDKVIDELDNLYIAAIRHNVPFDVATLCVAASMDHGGHIYYGVCHTKTRGIKGCRLNSNTLEFVEYELPIK